MALVITSQPDYIRPVVANQQYIATDTSANYFNFDMSINAYNQKYSVKQELMPINGVIDIDLSNILQNYIDSSLFIHPTSFYSNTNRVIYYNSLLRSTYNVGSSSYAYGTKYTFLGVDQWNSTWDVSSYIFDSSTSNNKFLNTFNTDRKIHLEDSVYLQFLQGTFFIYTSSFTGIAVTKVDNSGSSVTKTYDLTLDSSAKIASINVSPYMLNSIIPDLSINSTTAYYTVREKTGRSETVKINIYPKDTRFDRYYRIGYQDSLGCTEFYNFDLANTNTLKINKTDYIVNNITKIYNTKVEDSYTALTDWMCEDESLALKDLWSTSMACYMDSSTKIIPILIDESSKDILKKRNVALINYNIKFVKAQEYFTIKK